MRQLWIIVGATLAIAEYVKSQESTGRNLYSSRSVKYLMMYNKTIIYKICKIIISRNI